MYFLGIDGGGSSTEFILINEKGEILLQMTKETCHYKNTSFKKFEEIISKGILEVCEHANIQITDINYSYLGIPGYGEVSDDMPILEKIIEEIFQGAKFKIGNDAEVGWAGSLAAEPGINIVAGTGAIGFGVDPYNKTARASGWDYFIGDEGSAYWLGKKLLELFSKESDGRLKITPLYKIVREYYSLQEDFDLIDIMTIEKYTKRDELAKLSKLVMLAAEQNDQHALDLFSEAAYEHVLSISSIIDQLDFNSIDTIKISYSGGVFKSGEYMLNPLQEKLKVKYDNIELITPILSPIKGSALFASKLYFGNVKEEILDQLKD